MDIFEREEMLIGKEAVKGLSRKKVALFGVGGVGAVVGEILARSGVGTIAAIDNDKHKQADNSVAYYGRTLKDGSFGRKAQRY